MVSSVVSGLPVSLYHLILAAGKQPDVTQLNVVARPAIPLIMPEVGSVNVTLVMGTEGDNTCAAILVTICIQLVLLCYLYNLLHYLFNILYIYIYLM